MREKMLFRALTEIGDDLLLMAQQKRFPNPWKRWGKLAASIALVLCLATFALPYLPMGCGSAGAPKTESVTTTTTESTEAESRAEETEECVKEESAVEESAEMEEDKADGQEVVSVWFMDRRYELQKGPFPQPEKMGEQLGEVKSSDGRDLTGCLIFATDEEHAVYVQTPEGYWYAVLAEID